MEYMETMVEAIETLEHDGFSVQFSIDERGWIVGDDRRWAATQVTIDRTVRFEGLSNPADESIVLALRTDDGRCGTLVLPYGPDLGGDQADTVRALSSDR